jgi:hypothetical protein
MNTSRCITSIMVEVHLFREHNHDILDCLQRYYQEPKPPKTTRIKKNDGGKLNLLVLEHLHWYYLIIERKPVQHLRRLHILFDLNCLMRYLLKPKLLQTK